MLSIRLLSILTMPPFVLNEIGLLICSHGLPWLLNVNLALGALLIQEGIGLLISVLRKFSVFHLIAQRFLVILMLK